MRCWESHCRQLAKPSTEIRTSDLLRLLVFFHRWTPTMRTPCATSHHQYLGSPTLQHLRQGIRTLRIAMSLRLARPPRIRVDSSPLPLKIQSTLLAVHFVRGRSSTLRVPTPRTPLVKHYHRSASRPHLLPTPLSRGSSHNRGARYQSPAHFQTHTPQQLVTDCRRHIESL